MSVLESFYFMFGADTKGADAGLARTTKNAEHTAGALAKIEHHLFDMAREIGVAVGGFFAFEAIKEKISGTAEEMNRMREASERIGVDIGDLDAWSKSVEDAGGNAEAFQGTLKGLAADIAMVKTKGTSRRMAFFSEIGIDEKKIKDVMELLPQLADKFEKMDATEALGVGTKMGLDEVTIGLLHKGRKATEEMIEAQKKLGVMTDKDGKIIGTYDDTMDKHHRKMQQFWRRLTIVVIPAIEGIAAAMESMMDVFGDVVDFFSAHTAIFETVAWILGGALVGSLLASVGAAFASATAFGTLGKILQTLGAASDFAFFKMLRLVALPLLLGAAFMLFLDDIRTWQAGGDSVIGDVLGTWEDFETRMLDGIDTLKEQIGGMWDGAKTKWLDVIDWASRQIESKLAWMNKLIHHPIEAMADLGNAEIDMAKGAYDSFKKRNESYGAGIASHQEIENKSRTQPQPIGVPYSSDKKPQEISITVPAQSPAQAPLSVVVPKAVDIANNTPFNSSNSVTNSSTQKNIAVNVGSVTVNTQATDAHGTAAALGDELKAQIRDAAASHDNGVAA